MGLHVEMTIEGPAGPLNPALVGFKYFGAMTRPQVVATCISYLSKAMAACSVESLLTGAVVRDDGGGSWGPGFPEPIPSDELDDWHAIDSDSPVASAWGIVVGSGSTMAAVGTSVNVGETSTFGGRRNGRHFLPWVGTAALNGSGLVKSTVVADVETAANWRLLGSVFTQPAWWAGKFAVETPQGSMTLAEILAYTPRTAPARLRSRIR